MIRSSSDITLGVKVLDHFGELELPSYETEASAGMDLRAALLQDHSVTLERGQRALIPTGLVFEIPAGFEVQIRPRSGLALKHGVTCLNAPGTIDADYRGEVGIILINHSEEAFTITRGMRVAQMVVAPVAQVQLNIVERVSRTQRGDGGFGSTGLRD